MRHERDAVSRCSFDVVAVPGLLQTEDNAGAAFASAVPPFGEEELEAGVAAARLERQQVLHRKPPLIAGFVIAQGVLMQRHQHLAYVEHQRGSQLTASPGTVSPR